MNAVARIDALAPQWRPGLLALLALGPFFFISYGAANHWAAAQPGVPSIVFAWEAAIPLLPWTILPYWSIDLFYGLSLLLAASRGELRRHALRLLSAQLICVTCFVLWPLRFSTPRPPLAGWEGLLFDALAGFDLPFNQAPSLHIVLLLILWDFYRRRSRGALLWVVHGWSALIGLSVLTTYQHHAIDLPTGLAAGALCLWLWPLDGPTPWAAWRREPGRPTLAALYALGALACAAAALGLGAAWSRAAWLLGWPAGALALVALAYAGAGTVVFQKDAGGRPSLGARWLLAPHRWGAWLNARLWTRRLPSAVPVADGVWLGRLPLPWEPDWVRFASIIDLTAELDLGGHPGLVSLPLLDLAPPPPDRLRAAADAVEAQRRRAAPGPLLVGCALGFSRSAAVLLTWLCRSGRAATVDEALLTLRHCRPQVLVSPALLAAVAAAVGSPAEPAA